MNGFTADIAGTYEVATFGPLGAKVQGYNLTKRDAWEMAKRLRNDHPINLAITILRDNVTVWSS